MPMADAAAVFIAALLLFVQIRKLRREERKIHFNR